MSKSQIPPYSKLRKRPFCQISGHNLKVLPTVGEGGSETRSPRPSGVVAVLVVAVAVVAVLVVAVAVSADVVVAVAFAA
jgi:hypothetical protein